MGRKNYPPKEKKRRKEEARIKVVDDMNLKAEMEKRGRGRAVLGMQPPWKRKLAAALKKRAKGKPLGQ